MDNIQLCLECYQSKQLILDLYKKSPIFDLTNTTLYIQNKVYSDKTYSIRLIGNYTDILEANLFINGFNVDAKFHDGEFKLNNDKNRLFIDTFGFVQLSLSVIYCDGRNTVYFSNFINVMIKDDASNISICKMADYIYNNQEKLLLDDKMKSLDNANLKDSIIKTLETQLDLIRGIIRSYKENYRYFKNNSKFKLVPNHRVDNFEKLKSVNDKTINYIIQNPNELTLSTNSTGIEIDKCRYLPHKTLINDNKRSLDLYENQVVLSFLETLSNDISLIQTEVKNRIDVFNDFKTIDNGYIISACMIYGATEKKLKDFLSEISICKNEIIDLFRSYSNIFPIKSIRIKSVPKPTHIFLTVKQYYSIFKGIKKYYKFGIYNMERENFLIPFLANNQLYEYYVLLKLLNYLKQKDYLLLEKSKYLYKPNAKYYQNTRYCNTFNFQLRDKKVTLYYQPVIYLKPNIHSNNINILRNTRISMNNDKEMEGNYYLPDFIVKIQNNDKSQYLIIDAKYSNQKNVKSFYFPNLAYKYLFSLSTLSPNDEILGLCAINGKSTAGVDKLSSVYTEYIPTSHLPYADILTLSEDEDFSDESEHWLLFSKLFGKYSI